MSGKQLKVLATVALGLALITLALALPVSASAAELSFCLKGTEAGQCGRPEGLAVDRSTGHLYVTDRDNRRIDVFDSEGHFLFAFGWKVNKSAPAEELQKCTEATGCQPGSAGAGAGQFSNLFEEQALAVDNDSSSSSFHDLYAFDRGNLRVSKFDEEGHLLGSFGSAGSGKCQFTNEFKDPIAVGPGGTIYVGDTGTSTKGRIEKFNPTTFACEGESVIFNGPEWKITGLAVDGAGKLYVTAIGTGGGIRKYEWGEPTATLLETIDAGFSTIAVATDAAGHLWAGQSDPKATPGSGSYPVITEYELATGKPLGRFGYRQLGHAALLAPFPGSGGGTFASEESTRVRYLEAPSLPLGPIVPSSSVKASAVGNVQATLEAEANPEGKEASYHFEYLTQAAYEAAGDTFTGAEEVSGSLGSSNLFNVHYASATVGCPNPLAEAKAPKEPKETAIEAGECLIPETEYRFRFRATNADNPEGTGEAREEGTFTTKAPLEIIEGFATEAGTESARLWAKVDPLGVPTTGHFELVTQEQFEASEFEEAIEVPEGSELSFGSGSSAVTKSAVVTGLEPGTSYRYRVIATDPLLVEPVAGEETYSLRPFALSTQATCPANEAFRIGAAAALPDCRAYEMVSPLDKEGGDIRPLEEGFIELPAVLEQASVPGPGEPQRLAYGSYRAFGDAVSAPWTSQYVASRTSQGWRSEPLSPPKGRLNNNSVSSDTELKLLSPDLCEAWWLAYTSPPLAPAAVPGQPNFYYRNGAGCGLDHWEALTTLAPPIANSGLELQGAAEGGAGALYALKDSLATEAPSPPAQPGKCTAAEPGQNCVVELYYQAAGEGPPRYVCVLPNGEAIPSGGCSAGTGNGADGNFRLNTLANALSTDGSQVYWSAGKLYLRLNPGQPQSAVSGGVCTEPELACTLPVSAQAETEAGSSSSHYWTATPNGSLALFSTGGRLYEYDREAEEDHLIATGFSGLAGASEDLSRFYFASSSVLAPANAEGEAPEAGATNLYLYDSNRPEGERFSFVAWVPSTDVGGQSFFNPVDDEPVFNTSRVSPNGSTFAFMSRRSPETAAYPQGYDNADAVNGKAAAEAYLYEAEASSGGEGSLICISCNPTGARPVGRDISAKATNGVYWAAAHIPGWENSLYASRALSVDGKRLYFESTDALSPRDSNGASDVYEWQAPGSGSCKAGAPDYFSSNGGCLDLISSGQSPSLSHFLDATPDGHDVFFSTTQSLDPQDPGLVDIYDAREGGGFPSPPQPSPACEGEACQGAYEPPNDPTPASTAFQGAGNVKEAAKAKKKKKKAKHKRKTRKPKRHKHRANTPRAKEQR